MGFLTDWLDLQDLAALSLAETTPHSVSFSDRERVVEAFVSHRTLRADGFRPLFAFGTFVASFTRWRREKGA